MLCELRICVIVLDSHIRKTELFLRSLGRCLAFLASVLRKTELRVEQLWTAGLAGRIALRLDPTVRQWGYQSAGRGLPKRQAGSKAELKQNQTRTGSKPKTFRNRAIRNLT